LGSRPEFESPTVGIARWDADVFAVTVWSVIAEHAGSFLVGVFVGLALSSRYRIVKVRDPEAKTDARQS
jgi:hypothetical protein